MLFFRHCGTVWKTRNPKSPNFIKSVESLFWGVNITAGTFNRVKVSGTMEDSEKLSQWCRLLRERTLLCIEKQFPAEDRLVWAASLFDRRTRLKDVRFDLSLVEENLQAILANFPCVCHYHPSAEQFVKNVKAPYAAFPPNITRSG